MDFGIEGKVAVISGGTKGCGRAVAQELAREGAKVVIASREQANIDETLSLIEEAGGSAHGVVGNMTLREDVDRVVAEATRHFGSAPLIAISNLNAPDSPTPEQPSWGFDDVQDLGEYHRGFDTLVMSMVYLAKAVLPGMKAANWGRFVTLGSGAVKIPHAPPSSMVLSNIGRMGAVGLNKQLAFEFGHHNITFNIVATGAFATSRAVSYFQSRGSSVEEQEALMKKTPLGASRLGRPEEMGALVAFLCSTRASYINGETIGVNGGQIRSMY